MGTVVVALAILLAGGAGALVASSRPGLATRIGAATCVAGCALGLAGVASTFSAPHDSWHIPWDVPYGEISLDIDPLSGFFLLIVFGLCLAGAIYGASSLRDHGDPVDHARPGHHRSNRKLGSSWFFFNLLTASMAVVVMARNGVLFLVAWEVMTLASFLLVTFEDELAAVRDAGRLYLISTHTGTAFLVALFVAMAARTGSMDFERWREASVLTTAATGPPMAGLFFILALVGFGTKAGLVPFHVWLPEAHPAAPSHVSAVMSGAMIKMGIYGLLRSLCFIGPPLSWWGATLLALGVASALIGVLSAMVQQDIKRLLAYSSVENIGFIAIGIGLGLMGVTSQQPALAALGFAGALLHALNHAVFKGLLFLGAGAVAHEARTRRMDRLGGVMKSMPVTGACFFVGAAAIAGLPPFNGFVGEFLLYLASYRGVTLLAGARGLAPMAAVVGLSLGGGLAAACFMRLAGLTFLGQARDATVAVRRDPSRAMTFSMAALAGLCLLLGLAPMLAFPLLGPAVAALLGPAGSSAPADLVEAASLGTSIMLCAGLLVGLVAGLALCRRLLLRRREARSSITWDCGYDQPTARMQHTASSFSEPTREMFAMLLPERRSILPPRGYFPLSASFASEVGRPFQERFYRPVFGVVSRAMSRLRWLHHGRVQLYVLYIVVTLVIMLAWLFTFQQGAS
ncbi:MAG TPA: proton-conducting transporter membrane subunit [Patescibacteria group bacterium]|nr:proton-conducting transporter membrane subunit [Patescibacteria group bacterium]